MAVVVVPVLAFWAAVQPHRVALRSAPRTRMADSEVNSGMLSIATGLGGPDAGDTMRAAPMEPCFASLEPLANCEVYHHGADEDARTAWRQNSDMAQLVCWTDPGTRAADITVTVARGHLHVATHGETRVDGQLWGAVRAGDTYWELGDDTNGERFLLVELHKAATHAQWDALLALADDRGPPPTAPGA